MNSKAPIRWRLHTLRLVTLLVLLSLVARLGQLQLIEGSSFRSRAARNTIRVEYVQPIRGEVYASDGTTLLAASTPVFNIAVRPDALPAARAQLEELYSRLAGMLALTDTLTLSPTSALRERPGLASDLHRLLPGVALATSAPTLTLTLPFSATLPALQLTRVHSDVLHYQSAVETTLLRANLPPYLPVIVRPDVSRELALVLRENQALLPGVIVQQSYRRSYPRSADLPSLSHLLGFIRPVTAEELAALNPPPAAEALDIYLPSDVVGKAGVELSYEAVLRGTLGVRKIEVDVNQVAVGEPVVLRPARDGENLILSVDADLQRHAEATLRRWLAEADRRRQRMHPDYPQITKGVLVIMDVRTGAILASVSLPAYDNNMLNRPLSQAEAEELFANPLTPMLNRAIEGHYPPGSTFKQVSAAVALQLGVIGPDSAVHDPGFLQVESEYQPGLFYDQFRNAIGGDRGMINVVEALKNSSNVFFYQVIGGTRYVKNLRPDDPRIDTGVGVDQFSAAAQDWFGLGAPTGIDLPGEISGFMPTREWKEETKHETWSVGNTYNIAIGQGDVLLTPLQLLAVTAAIANGGTRYRPHTVRAISSPDGAQVRDMQPEVLGRLPVDPHYLAIIREGMRQSVHERSAHNVVVAQPQQLALYSQLRLAGKTGTAEYIEDGRDRSHSWFVGFAPYDNPQVAAVVFLEGTGDLQDGSGTLALPAVAEALAPLFGVSGPSATGSSR